MANKILKPVIVNELVHMMRGAPARSVDPRLAYNAQREELDKRRGAVSPLLTGVAKPAPPRPGLKNR
jgi:hypothetical protein